MSTVASPVRAHQRSTRRIRHGTCQLRIIINNDEYTLKKDRPLGGLLAGGVTWRLRQRTGPRAGAVYFVARAWGKNACTCADHVLSNGESECKHVRALVAAGLISGRKRRSRARAARPEGGAS
ncbi:MAG: hypothetical protein JO252_11415 [Planctomycetaceae bacterium]|nr:hypothetical protein [Planctomycetaceae bacterium]